MIKSKALSLTLSAAMIASLAGLVGCGYNTNGNTTRTHNVGMNNNGRMDGNLLRNNSYGRTDGNMLRNNNNNNVGTQHDLTNVKYSKTLSEKISRVKGVRDAHVFVTKNNAYVSLSLDGQTKNHVTNPNTTSNMRSMGTDGTTLGMNGRYDGMYGNSVTGGGLLRGMSDPRGTLDNNTGLGTSAGTGRFGVSGNTMRGTGLMGMNNTGTLNRTDGRFGTMNNQSANDNVNTVNSVPKHVRDEVSTKIRKTLPNVKEVYCSSDTGFYEHARGYSGNNIGGGAGNRDGNIVGNTIGTLGHDLGAWINRLFPLGNDGMNTYGTGHPNRVNDNGYNDGLFNMNRNRR
ncbi:hypothetical protein [Paenibacillus dakarensis]|uniref:hypothetical protein n=1 Tax=Paenibacillus dakarensis TaxID=1527293 RepID=UPI0006D5395C|nr:hypothetical protein [Paenibacillus dakarensis]